MEFSQESKKLLYRPLGLGEAVALAVVGVERLRDADSDLVLLDEAGRAIGIRWEPGRDGTVK
jgi:hypothetical protein